MLMLLTLAGLATADASPRDIATVVVPAGTTREAAPYRRLFGAETPTRKDAAPRLRLRGTRVRLKMPIG